MSFFVLTHVLVSSLMALAGCATSQPVSPPPTSPLPSSHTQSLLEETKVEAEELRSALATERITLAKQQAEVRTVQEALSDMRKREVAMVKELGQVKTEIATLEAERNQVHKENAQLRGKTTAMPQLLQLMTEIRSVQTSLNSLVSDVHLLKTDIATLHTELRNSRKPIQVTRPHTQSLGNTSMRGGHLLTVQSGDSLWKISRTYGVSVKQLQELNNLKSDQIFPGQQLRLRMKVARQHDPDIPSEVKIPVPLKPVENP